MTGPPCLSQGRLKVNIVLKVWNSVLVPVSALSRGEVHVSSVAIISRMPKYGGPGFVRGNEPFSTLLTEIFQCLHDL